MNEKNKQLVIAVPVRSIGTQRIEMFAPIKDVLHRIDHEDPDRTICIALLFL